LNEEDFVDPVEDHNIFDDTDEDPTFDLHCNVVEPSDEIQQENIHLLSEEDFVDDPVEDNDIFDDTDEDPTFDPHCNIVEPSDEDEQVINIIEDDELVSTHSLEINQNNGGRPKKGRKRKHIYKYKDVSNPR